MPRETLKPVDILRHELKALRFILDRYHIGAIPADQIPPRDDFQSEQARSILDAIVAAPDRASAEKTIRAMDLDEVDIESFLRLAGDHYYAYPDLVRQRAAAIRRGDLKIEST
jgi:hypothetical protein